MGKNMKDQFGEIPQQGRPDPTDATEARIERAAIAVRDYVDGQIGRITERLNGIDKATELLSQTVNRVPTEVTKEITHVRGLIDEQFASIATQFKERDTRSERESRDNKVAVDAAFAAQKEAASEQNKSNTLAITKSEVATTETINKLAELFRTTTDALADKIDDLKERVGAMEANKVGRNENEQRRTQNVGQLIAFAGLAVVAFSTAISLLIKFG